MRFNRIIERYEQEFHALVTSMKLAKLMLLILAMGHWLGEFRGLGCRTAWVGCAARSSVVFAGLPRGMAAKYPY